jgi:hypothetical protein
MRQRLRIGRLDVNSMTVLAELVHLIRLLVPVGGLHLAGRGHMALQPRS